MSGAKKEPARRVVSAGGTYCLVGEQSLDEGDRNHCSSGARGAQGKHRRRRKRPLPLALVQLGADCWRVAYVGRPAFECSTSSLRWVLGPLAPQVQRQVVRAALRARERSRAEARP